MAQVAESKSLWSYTTSSGLIVKNKAHFGESAYCRFGEKKTIVNMKILPASHALYSRLAASGKLGCEDGHVCWLYGEDGEKAARPSADLVSKFSLGMTLGV